MTTTANLGITLLESAQAQKEITINEALARIDAVLNCAVVDKDLATPPGSPTTGAVYIVASSPTGAWTGKAKQLAYYDQTWRFIVPKEGLKLWVADEDATYLFDGTNWIITTSGMSASTYDAANIAQQVVGTTATQTLTNKTIDALTHTGIAQFGNSASNLRIRLNATSPSGPNPFIAWYDQSNVQVGYIQKMIGSNFDIVNSEASGIRLQTNGSNVRLGVSSAGAITFPAISTTASAANAYLDSGASNNLLRSTSSIRYKHDVETVTPEYSSKIFDIRPVWYRSKAEADNPEWGWYGIIAEELAEVLPQLVHWAYPVVGTRQVESEEVVGEEPIFGEEKVPDGVQYERLTVLLLAELKQLRTEFDALSAQVEG